MDLHIFDVSNYIYAGAYSNKKVSRGVRETNGRYEENSAPIGGVAYLLSRIARIAIDPNCIVIPVFDNPPEIKRQMYGEAFGDPKGYKGTRPTKRFDVNPQKDYAEIILRDIGFPVQSLEGYEADDIIYSLVKYYKDDFEHIYIHTRDSDLFFLVDNNVSIATVTKQDKVINRWNYELSVKSGEHVLFNTIHFRKMCSGDSSDNIPGVGIKWGEKLDEIIEDDMYERLGDLDLCRKYIIQAVAANPDIPGGHNVLRTFNIICPLLVPFEALDNSEFEIDWDKFSYYQNDWDSTRDKWNLEDMLRDYIDSYYE